MVIEKENLVFQDLYQRAFADGFDVGILISKVLFNGEE